MSFFPRCVDISTCNKIAIWADGYGQRLIVSVIERETGGETESDSYRKNEIAMVSLR